MFLKSFHIQSHSEIRSERLFILTCHRECFTNIYYSVSFWIQKWTTLHSYLPQRMFHKHFLFSLILYSELNDSSFLLATENVSQSITHSLSLILNSEVNDSSFYPQIILLMFHSVILKKNISLTSRTEYFSNHFSFNVFWIRKWIANISPVNLSFIEITSNNREYFFKCHWSELLYQ